MRDLDDMAVYKVYSLRRAKVDYGEKVVSHMPLMSQGRSVCS